MTHTVKIRRVSLMARLWAVLAPTFERAAHGNFDRPWEPSAG